MPKGRFQEKRKSGRYNLKEKLMISRDEGEIMFK